MKTFYSNLIVVFLVLFSTTASGQLYWSDSFGSYASGDPLNGSGTWHVQESPTVGYLIQSATPLTYPSLQSNTNYAIGGYNYWASGVTLPLTEGSPLVTNHISDADPGLIGYKSGSSNVLWFSELVRADANDYCIIDFHSRGGEFAWWVDTWQLGIMRNAGSHAWGIIINNDERQFSSVTTEVGEVTLVVAKLEFATDGITISLYINPTPGVEPTTPAISGKTTLVSGIVGIQHYMGFNANEYSWDEVRLGETYADVTPTTTATKITKTVDPNLNVYATDGKIIADLSNIKGNLKMQLFDTKGLLVKSVDVVGGGSETIMNYTQKGLYLIKVSNATQTLTNKVVCK